MKPMMVALLLAAPVMTGCHWPLALREPKQFEPATDFQPEPGFSLSREAAARQAAAELKDSAAD